MERGASGRCVRKFQFHYITSLVIFRQHHTDCCQRSLECHGGGGNSHNGPWNTTQASYGKDYTPQADRNERIQMIIRWREDSIKEGLGWTENWLRVLEGDYAGQRRRERLEVIAQHQRYVKIRFFFT